MPQVFQDFSDNKVSNLVVDQLPEFVAEQYPNFVLFVQAYYEWLEQNGNVINQLKDFPNYLDIDYVFENSLTQFVNEFQQMYMASMPTNILADKAKVLKNIKQFYSSRGTPKSFEFLFRILFNAPVQVGNPGTQILKASAGQWYQPTVLRITPQEVALTTINEIEGLGIQLGQSQIGVRFTTLFPISNWINLQIFGGTSFATAIVVDAQTNFSLGVQYTELTVTNISKSFLPNEIITGVTPTGQVMTGTLLGIIPGIFITDPGSKYNVGDPVIITGGGGANANAFISKVSSGTLVGISVTDGGSGFQLVPNFNVNITGSLTPTSAQITNVDTSGSLSPNTYTFNTDLLSTNYSGVALGVTSNTPIVNTWNTVKYANCGPIVIITVFDGGSGYTGPPGLSVSEVGTIGNTGTVITQYGTIGTLKIVNPGLNYSVNDDIKIVNLTSRGVAGGGIVTSVNASGSITSVYVALPSIDGIGRGSAASNVLIGTNTKFTTQLFANNNATYPNSGSFISINGETHRVATIANNTQLTVEPNFINSFTTQPIRLQGFPLGGMGYLQSDLPYAVNCLVSSQTGSGAVIQADSILGSGAVLDSTGGSYGRIQNVTMANFGDHYSSQPDISFPTGDGTARGTASVISGQFSYPGYFLNEDGMLSSRRYLENADMYNTYTYTLTSPVAVESYRNLIQNILHPVGSNMIGITNITGQTPYLNANTIGSLFINLGTILLDEIDIDFVLDYSVMSGVYPGNIVGVNFFLSQSLLI